MKVDKNNILCKYYAVLAIAVYIAIVIDLIFYAALDEMVKMVVKALKGACMIKTTHLDVNKDQTDIVIVKGMYNNEELAKLLS